MNRITMTAFALLTALSSFSFAMPLGKETGNGGDTNEMKFKEIATNIEQWIQTNQAYQLKFPAGTEFGDYKRKMLAALASYSVSFTDDKILVAGVEKICKNTQVGLQNQILCNNASFDRIYQSDMNDVFRIVHHEFAGLAGLEVNTGSVSDYSISSQMSGYLYQEVVTRLPVMNYGDLQLTRKPLCLSLAYSALMKKFKVAKDAITYLGGAVIGDGAAVVEIDILTIVSGKKSRDGSYTPSPQDGAYKIEFINDQADGCTLKESDAEIKKLNI